ncbi:alpha/beta fold hydrolase [Thermomonospora umbrina]|uniref:alpha/beta fold hydrolase n=1 Tax=Thermomonospora umbrina TaxID=111806 RepID=UPI001B86DC32|nr:alpha/beta hydrolase [Thermomonospora umbrina]
MTEFVKTSCLEIGYERWGPPDGPVVVLAHGWPDDVHCWDEVTPALTEAGCRVLAPYLRGFGPTRFLEDDRPRSGQIGALGHDLAEFIERLDLRDVVVSGHDWGARAAYVVGAVFPERLRGLVAMSAGYAASGPDQEISFPLARAYWYEWFVATRRGRETFDRDRRRICRYLWESWSPGWRFDNEAFERSAAAWDNPDWHAITVHAYLQRWGEAAGDPAYDDLEDRLAHRPPITVPSIVLHGGRDADNLPETTEGKESLFTAGYERNVLPGIGHALPREAPRRSPRPPSA